MTEQSKVIMSETFTESTPWLLAEGQVFYPEDCLGDRVGFFESPETAKLYLKQNPDSWRDWTYLWNVTTGEEVNDLHD